MQKSLNKKKIIIAPVFIPHEGCPYRCVFCNQADITGFKYSADRENFLNSINRYLRPTNNSIQISRREIAFYGGSFTGLSENRQKFLLSLAQPFIQSGLVDGIRVSTHPKLVGESQLKLIKKFNVDTIELGMQSTNS